MSHEELRKSYRPGQQWEYKFPTEDHWYGCVDGHGGYTEPEWHADMEYRRVDAAQSVPAVEPTELLELINNYGRACRRDGNPSWESREGKALSARLAVIAAPVAAQGEPVGWQINLTEEGGKQFAWLLSNEDGEDPFPVVLSLGNGASGYGLYGWYEEYPEEGAHFIQTVAASPAAQPVPEPKAEDLYCPQCNGSGEGREMTQGHGPDDYERDCPCQLCGGDGSLLAAFNVMKAERDELRKKYQYGDLAADMAMMIRRLCSTTANAKTRELAMELLDRHGHASPLRDAAQPVPAACPKCASEEWDNVTAERGRERDVPFNRCSRCETEWSVS